MSLKTVRSHLQIIPQDPVIFNGTIRSNLDPTSTHPDSHLWQVLEAVGLKDYISSQSQKLDHPIVDHGQNLSVGQRALLGIARALLMRPKVLVMDESTSALDSEGNMKVQELLQRSTQQQNKDEENGDWGLNTTSVLSIAHNLKSVAAFDRVMVLHDGALVEFDTPLALLEKAGGSVFKGMVDATGPANAEAIYTLAAAAHRGKNV
jgi:ABC-type multidrug transport system fused ATPase/permease subunit